MFASRGRASRPLCIEPGSPWENGYVENFNGKLRDELLDREISYTLWEAQVPRVSPTRAESGPARIRVARHRGADHHSEGGAH